jgi:hypothetical protein
MYARNEPDRPVVVPSLDRGKSLECRENLTLIIGLDLDRFSKRTGCCQSGVPVFRADKYCELEISPVRPERALVHESFHVSVRSSQKMSPGHCRIQVIWLALNTTMAIDTVYPMLVVELDVWTHKNRVRLTEEMMEPECFRNELEYMGWCL